MRALVITPAYSHAHHGLHEAIRESGMPWLPLYGHSDLVRVRSILISHAIERAEVVVFVDADNVPAPGVLERIAAMPTPERAVFGIYRLRDGDRLSVAVADEEAAERAIQSGEQFPIVHAGLGLAAVHRDSLLRVADTLPVVKEADLSWRPFCMPFVAGGEWHGDDKSLCHRLRSAGVGLVADPTLTVAHAVSTLLAGPNRHSTSQHR